MGILAGVITLAVVLLFPVLHLTPPVASSAF
jgi:hypothetical protein